MILDINRHNLAGPDFSISFQEVVWGRLLRLIQSLVLVHPVSLLGVRAETTRSLLNALGPTCLAMVFLFARATSGPVTANPARNRQRRLESSRARGKTGSIDGREWIRLDE